MFLCQSAGTLSAGMEYTTGSLRPTVSTTTRIPRLRVSLKNLITSDSSGLPWDEAVDVREGGLQHILPHPGKRTLSPSHEVARGSAPHPGPPSCLLAMRIHRQSFFWEVTNPSDPCPEPPPR